MIRFGSRKETLPCAVYAYNEYRQTFLVELGPEVHQFFFALFAAMHAQIVTLSLLFPPCDITTICHGTILDTFWTSLARRSSTATRVAWLIGCCWTHLSCTTWIQRWSIAEHILSTWCKRSSIMQNAWHTDASKYCRGSLELPDQLQRCCSAKLQAPRHIQWWLHSVQNNAFMRDKWFGLGFGFSPIASVAIGMISTKSLIRASQKRSYWCFFSCKNHQSRLL